MRTNIFLSLYLAYFEIVVSQHGNPRRSSTSNWDDGLSLASPTWYDPTSDSPDPWQSYFSDGQTWSEPSETTTDWSDPWFSTTDTFSWSYTQDFSSVEETPFPDPASTWDPNTSFDYTDTAISTLDPEPTLGPCLQDDCMEAAMEYPSQSFEFCIEYLEAAPPVLSPPVPYPLEESCTRFGADNALSSVCECLLVPPTSTGDVGPATTLSDPWAYSSSSTHKRRSSSTPWAYPHPPTSSYGWGSTSSTGKVTVTKTVTTTDYITYISRCSTRPRSSHFTFPDTVTEIYTQYYTIGCPFTEATSEIAV
ncbi:uncharacterized protein JN550_003015 [Neoarthrinium moseri]|uniref:uncharacterized protein n=1 Tax=Neoarthrinium moseri TaxID=1658444 RepID=UPI001FDB26F6|nr:uncharacterized protein JN550_003015 [Neoarthrinium moseri]KAI1873746.1 hypothetical protein JN550_003015 [Neoarthrinium moseri]